MLSVTEPGPNGSETTSSPSTPGLGGPVAWALALALLLLLMRDDLSAWHLPALLAYWPLVWGISLARGVYNRRRTR